MNPAKKVRRPRAAARTSRLLKVLVIGGAVLAAACTGKSKAGGSREGGSAPERGGGVSSW
jgi:hypothetical protein